MARTSTLGRLSVMVGAAALVLSGCSFGGDTTDDDDVLPSGSVRSDRDDKLDFGFIYPETGGLAALGVPQLTAFELAIADINAAGGVNGHEVTAMVADEAGEAAAVRSAAAHQINAGVDVVIGAASSGMSQEIIQLLHDSRVVQCSGSNTSPTFSDQENNTYYFRTIPPDEAVAPVIAETMIDDGASRIAVVARADDYGIALADLLEGRIERLGASVAARIDYDPDAESFGDEVSRILDSNADAVALIAFGEGGILINEAVAAGVDVEQFYGSDGLFDPQLGASADVDLDGMKVFAAAGGTAFNDRLDDALPAGNEGNYIYGGQVYDCVIVSALAAIAADSVDPAVFYATVPDVTQDGTECSSFEECKELLEAGQEIDYAGASGPIALDHPDPTFGRYAIGQFRSTGGIEVIGELDVDLGELGRPDDG
jgi:ABC-type branched-subunit amino acid transport system substrate-binding protein